jgi:hypothetical protein
MLSRAAAVPAPAVTPPVLDSHHVLHVSGTDGSDRITLCRIVPPGADEIRVVVNKRRWYFATAAIKRIEIDSGADRDLVQVDADSAPLRTAIIVMGGAGDDTISGASGADTLCGQDGNDSIIGGTGDDYLEGGAGNDTIFGGKGDDRLLGEAGNDSLNDDVGDNDYLGGSGKDAVKRGITGPGQFIIGVWGQTSGSSLKWKSRGVNTMVAAELYSGRIPLSQWDAEVTKNGMYMIRQPSDDPQDDAAKENLIAWLAPDEPDVHHTDPKSTQAAYARLKRVNPDIPVFLNFSGGHVVGYQERNWKHPYAGWIDGADWVSNDIYPVAGWNLPRRLGLVGEAIDRLRAVDPTKPQFAFIEAGDQGLPWNLDAPGPTPDQMRAEIWNAVIHGARGIVYFTDQFKPTFAYDATTPDIQAEMKRQDAILTDLSGPLLARIDPRGYGIELPSGMEGTVRVWKGKVYLIVQNLTSRHKSAVQINLRGVPDGTAQVYGQKRTVQVKAGQIVDDFDGYTPRVYVIG